jgi:peptide deformylase
MNLKLELVPYNHPAMKEPTLPYDFDNPPIPPDQLFAALAEFMIKNRGMGLAANQVGIPYNVFVFGDPTNADSIIPVFNPNILSRTGDEYYSEEGCLTFPGLYVKIKRYNVIRTRYTTHENITDTIKLSGMSSRIFQHEYDHLHGILYTKRAHAYHLAKARKDLKKVIKLRKKLDEKNS